MVNELYEPIAIVGLAGRFPGAPDANEFWLNLCAGRESVHYPADEELLAAGVPAASLRDPNYIKAVALAPDIDRFDAEFFGLTPKEAALCDPQIKLFLETAHAAMENAGYDPHRVMDVGVFGSAGVNRYVDQHIRAADGGTMRSATGMSLGVLSNSDYVATLVSYKYNFRGPSMTVQTACSSSMVAVHLAAGALRNGECGIALAGGADVEFPFGHGHWWAPGSPLTRDGHCRPFDSRATGTIFSSGAGVVVLKRLSDALADGDQIRAVLRSMAVNNDGSDKVGFSAPGLNGQAAVITEAMAVAGIRPDQVSLVEAHSTGTVLGDPVEVAALNQAYRGLAGTDLVPGACHLGSVKGNVGHLGHAAGVTSLIKVVLALENERIPPSINFEEPNPKIEFDGSPFAVATRLRPWPRVPGRPRLAGVNSLGIGGTNVHAVVQEAPERTPAAVDGRPRLVVWSARSQAAAHAYEEKLGDFLATSGEHGLPDVVSTLQHGRTAHRVRAATVAATPAEAVASLRGGRAGVLRSGRPGDPREVVFLFPGQGSQHPRMAAGLYERDRTFAARLDECFELFERHGLPVRRQWSADGTDADLEPTEVAQPLLFSLGYAVAGMWESLGVSAAGLLGHSIGELTAAAVAGVFDLPDAIRLVAARARAMREAPPGAMLAVAAPAEAVRDLLVDGVCLAAVNSRRQTVVAGPAEALTAFAGTLAERGVRSRRARTSHAFHSTAMAPAAARFLEAFEGVVAKPPRIALYSAATGQRMTDEQATSARFWADQLVEPVLFGPALDTVLSGPPKLLLEMGPGKALTSVAKQHPATADGDHLVVSTLPAGPTTAADEERAVLAAVGQLWTDGHTIDWGALAPDEPVRRIAMPGYQYQRERHWIDVPVEPEPEPERVAEPAAQPPAEATPQPAPATPQPTPASPFTTVGWAEQSRSGTAARPGTVALVLLPPDRERALDTVAALHEADLRVVPVHPGAAYGETGSGFTVRIGEAEDVARVSQTLAARGSLPGLLVHAVTLGTWPAPSQELAQEQLDSSFHSLHALIQHGGRHRSDGQLPGLLVLSERSADVAGGEPLDPVKATLHGVVRTFAAEQPVTAAKLIDVGSTVDISDLVEEVRHRDGSEIVALRVDRRWVPVERAYPLVPSGRPVLRRDGVYVISGGLGGLGMVVARELAATGMRPRLVLLGRSAVPEDDERLAELAELGARVRALACDVTNPRALRRAGEIVTAQFGPVNGVLHLAGVAGDGMLQFRGRQDAERVLAPKVFGTLALWDLFRDRAPLDFFVCFSSRAAFGGMVGSGDYAAANAFLDAFARTAQAEGGRVVSVNWPGWATVGMAAAGFAAPPSGGASAGGASAGGASLGGASAGGANGRAAAGSVHAPEPVAGDELSWGITLRAETTPALDEHRLDGIPVLPGTGHLDLVVRAFRDRVLGGADRPVRLADVVFQRPLAVPEERRVRIVLVPSGEWWRFTVQSQPTAGADAETQVHVVGRVAAADPQPRRIDLAALAARLTERRDPPVREVAGRFFTLGPRWDNVREIRSRPGDRSEQLLRLELPERFAAEAAEHALHPTLLDAATAYARDSRHEAPHLPFMYRSMVVHGPLPARLSSSIRRGEGSPDMIVADVDLVDADGQVLVEISGFTMRRVKDEMPAFAATLRADAPPAPSASPPRQPAPPPGQPAPVPPAGLPPETGGRLFMDLLGARTPRQVAVLPYRNGVPLPLDVAPDAGVPVPGTAGVPIGAAPAPAAGPVPAPAPAPSAVTPAEQVPVAGGDPVEARLGALWTEALGVVDIAGSDDFFDLGGNSLSAVELMSRIQDTFHVELSITALFDYPTLQAFADELRRMGAR